MYAEMPVRESAARVETAVRRSGRGPWIYPPALSRVFSRQRVQQVDGIAYSMLL